MFQIFENKIQLVQYFLLWILYCILHILSIKWLLNTPFEIILLDGIIHAGIFSAIGILLGNIISYVNYKIFPRYLKMLNLILLGIFATALWISISFGVEYIIVNSNYIALLKSTLALKVLIGILLSTVIILLFIIKLTTKSIINDELPLPNQNTQTINKKEFNEYLDKIAIKTGSKIDVISISDILYLQADGDYVHKLLLMMENF